MIWMTRACQRQRRPPDAYRRGTDRGCATPAESAATISLSAAHIRIRRVLMGLFVSDAELGQYSGDQSFSVGFLDSGDDLQDGEHLEMLLGHASSVGQSWPR